MGKIRRGGFVFVTWKGDHSPYHVHVYRDGTLVLKWPHILRRSFHESRPLLGMVLENHLAMKGKPTNRILRLITELSEEGLL